MYLKIRKLSAKPGESDLIINISKMALIQDLRQMIFDEINVEMAKQRLFYKGKQLIDDHKIMDYEIQLNDVIQLLIQVDTEPTNKSSDGNKNLEKDTISNSDESPASTSQSTNQTNASEIDTSDKSIEEPQKKLEKGTSKYFRIDDKVDALDTAFGAWLEACIVDILKKEPTESKDETNREPDLIFRIKWEWEVEECTEDVSFNHIRPRAKYTYKKSELAEGNTVLVNYNIEQPSLRGYWYDFVIKKVTIRNLKGLVLVGKDRTELKDCTIKFIDEVKRIEKPILFEERSDNYNSDLPALRKNTYYCEKCKDVNSKPCKHCGCSVCSGKNLADTIILCDECDTGYHTICLSPPLEEMPPDEEDWYCPMCKVDENEIVKAGDKLKFSNKKAKMASAKQDSNTRDWGRGMACVGRTKECTIVPKNHYGPIPGVDVGTCWKYRMQVSEAGVHRPHVAGIHGRETDGAYSLILSGGYEDDIDNGNEFIYTGSGGRDLSGNKRVNDQSCDQQLTRMNRALALNCNVPLNTNGAEATDWKGGKPVRVARNYKISKFSTYGPKDGNRYDGIYKVVKYYPERGLSGFLVWKYVLRRDDPEPAPWEEGGQELEMLYPPGFLEAQAAKQKEATKANQQETSKAGSKRKRSASTEQADDTSKKNKVAAFKLNEKIRNAIELDENNSKLWDECKTYLKNGKQVFLSKVEELFMCVCCQEVLYLPITTECKHNVCKACLERSFTAGIYNCPYCRFEMGKDFKFSRNENLSTVLLSLFPGYEANR